nr:MAG TPA: hypothetical protein [Caudoviricetes sp.]
MYLSSNFFSYPNSSKSSSAVFTMYHSSLNFLPSFNLYIFLLFS